MNILRIASVGLVGASKEAMINILKSAKADDAENVLENCAVLIGESSEEEAGEWTVKAVRDGDLHKALVSHYVADNFPLSVEELEGMSEEER